MPTNFLSTLCGVLFAACGAGAVAGPGVTVLRSFNNVDGQYPIGRLLYGSDGRIYGTTYGGGAAGSGTVGVASGVGVSMGRVLTTSRPLISFSS